MVQELFGDYLPIIAKALFRAGSIFVITLGVVYIIGRMLGIAKSYRTKNAIALITMAVASYYSVVIFDLPDFQHPYEVWWWTGVYTSLCAIFYTLIGFDLYDRWNAWTDKKFIKPKNQTPLMPPTKKSSKKK